MLLVDLVRHCGFDVAFMTLYAAYALDLRDCGHDVFLVLHFDENSVLQLEQVDGENYITNHAGFI